MNMNTIRIDPNKAKDIWYALYGLCYAVEHLDYIDEANTLIDKTTELGAHEYARKTILESVFEETDIEQGFVCSSCGTTVPIGSFGPLVKALNMNESLTHALNDSLLGALDSVQQKEYESLSSHAQDFIEEINKTGSGEE